MKAGNSQNWMRKLGSLAAVLGLSTLFYLPTLARANPKEGNNYSQNSPRPAQNSPEANPSSEGTNSTSQGGTIVAIASSNDQFKTLTKALEAAGLTETLAGTGPFTVFAPTDAAFSALPPETLQALLKPENKNLLVKILTYHVVPGKVLSSDLKNGEVKTVEGSPVNVRVDADQKQVLVNDARVIRADIQASNGVIHIIDRIILPTEVQSTSP